MSTATAQLLVMCSARHFGSVPICGDPIGLLLELLLSNSQTIGLVHAYCTALCAAHMIPPTDLACSLVLLSSLPVVAYWALLVLLVSEQYPLVTLCCFGLSLKPVNVVSWCLSMHAELVLSATILAAMSIQPRLPGIPCHWRCLPLHQKSLAPWFLHLLQPLLPTSPQPGSLHPPGLDGVAPCLGHPPQGHEVGGTLPTRIISWNLCGFTLAKF